MRNLKTRLLPGIIVMVLLLTAAAGMLHADRYIILNMRLYKGTVGDNAPTPTVVTTSYVEPYLVGNIASPADLQKEQEKLKRVYNVSNVQLMIQYDWHLIESYPPRVFQIFKENGNTFSIMLTREKTMNQFRVQVYDGKKSIEDKNLLDTRVMLEEEKTVILGFKDAKGKIFFVAFHRQKDADKVKKFVHQDESGKKKDFGVLLSTQYKAELQDYVPPVYPVRAMEKGIQGRVFVRAEIDGNGKVVKAQAISGPKELQKSAVEAVKKWRYKKPGKTGQSGTLPFTAVISFNQGAVKKKAAQKPVSLIGNAREFDSEKGVPGVKVVVENNYKNFQRSTVTDSSGVYGFMDLPAGAYTITYKKEGYMTIMLKKSFPGDGKTYKLIVKLKKK